jgi:heat shock protein HslJ
MACPPPGNAIEQAYNAALGKVAKWSVENEQLVLRSADGKDLLTYRTATVIGAWDATSVHRGDSIQSVIIGSKITATFSEDGTLSGSAGCNTYNTGFTLNQGSIKIAQPVSTRMACDKPEGVSEQEHDYLASLPTAASYRIEGSRMTLLTAAGTIVATYDRAP